MIRNTSPWRHEWPLLAAVFLDLLGFGMLIPDIQFRAEAMGAPGWVIGSILGSMFVVQLIASPRWGSLSDRVGRKPVLLTCTLISAAGMAVYGFANTIAWMFASRILGGLGAANVAVGQAFIADRAPEALRAGAMGRVGAAISTGLISGPAITALLQATHHIRWVGFIAAGCSLLGALLIALGLPDGGGRVADGENPMPRTKRRPILDLSLLSEFPSLTPLVIAAVVSWFSLATLEGTFGRLIEKLLGYGRTEFGIIFSYESLLGILVQGLLLAWLVRRFRQKSLLEGGYLLQGVGLMLNPLAGLLQAWVPGFAVLMIASTLYAVGSSIANPTINSLCSRLTPESRQGELFGLLQGSRSIGFVAGPVIGGRLFDWQPAAPYVLAGVACMAAALVVQSSHVDQAGHGVGG